MRVLFRSSSAFFAVDLDELRKAVEAEEHCSAKIACGLKSLLDGRQTVERGKLVEHETGAKTVRPRHRPEARDGQVRPRTKDRRVGKEGVSTCRYRWSQHN